MKIDTNRTSLDSLGTVRTDGTESTATSSAGRTVRPAPSDEVQFSSSAQLAGAAAKAAAGVPDIRPGEVERARSLLESGKLGADPFKLADALIDRAIEGD
ncbi:MAG: flagellar biosynthesis anti-sigma factor FlgM [Acidobacteria bacterium]|nr:flagellar biosynthesis anti-sigma factor FlgM [Acidobacteriota bacterium]